MLRRSPLTELPGSGFVSTFVSSEAALIRASLDSVGADGQPTGDATSPYLLQHADNPVDWWEWGPEAFAEARRRDVPVLLSVGYAACHWCHVMAHESFEDEATAALPERALRQHQGRPRGAARRRRGLHAGDHRDDRAGRLADDRACSTTTASRSSPAPTSPTSRGTGSRRSGRCWRRSSEAWRDRARRGAPRRPATLREHLRQPARAGRGRRSTRRDARQRGRAAGARVRRRRAAGSAARRSSRRRWCWSSCSAHGRPTRDARDGRRDAARRWPAAGSTTSSAAGSPATASTPTGWCRTSRRCSTTTRCCCGVYAGLAAPTVGVRVAEETADFLLGELRHGRGRLRLRARRRHARAPRAPSTSGRRRSWSRCSAPTTARGPRELLAVTDAGTFEHGTSTLQLRDGPRRPRALVRDVQRRLLAARDRAGAAGPRRQGGRRLERAGDQRPVPRPGTLLGEPAYVDAAVAARRAARGGVHLVDGRLRRVSRDGVVGAPAGVLEDYGCVAAGFLALLQATGDAVVARAGGRAARQRARALRAPTTAASSTPPTTPRRWWPGRGTRPTTPRRRGLSAVVHALVDVRRPDRRRAATATPPRRRSATVAPDRRAGAALRRLVARRGRGHARRAGRGRGRRPRRPGARRARAPRAAGTPARSWWSPTAPATTYPLLVGRDAGRRPAGGVRLPRPRLRASGHHRRGPSGGAYRGVGSAHAG